MKTVYADLGFDDVRIVLAPMEGLADVHLRRLITSRGGYDWAVTEFVRVVDKLLPDRVFKITCPELANHGHTDNGTPVRVQLLGNKPEAMAENALAAIRLGSHGIDINFGCPSKTVNKSQGGAVLLREPETLYKVVKAVRDAVPPAITVSAKMRLGFDDTVLMLDNVRAIESAGATELTVHARTRAQGYAPPAHWHELTRIRENTSMPLIANGDIWTVDDFERCTDITGTSDVMLGRGAIRHPDLARAIRDDNRQPASWHQANQLLVEFWTDIRVNMPLKYRAGRLKQWVNHLRKVHVEAELLWHQIKTVHCLDTLDLLVFGGHTPEQSVA